MIESCHLGKTNIQISRLCFGGWQASGWTSSNDENFKSTLNYALDAGINFIDTAEAYGDGHSERLIGEVIRSRKRADVVIATKFSHSNSQPQRIRQSLHASLERLKTHYIDLYQQHWPPRKPPLSECISELERLKHEGKIRAIGVSNWMEPEWSEIDNPDHIDSLQPCYSLLWRTVESSVLPLCIKHSIAVLPYSPLCQGLLSGRFSQQHDIPNDFRSKNRMFSETLFPAVQKFLLHLVQIANYYHKPISAVALRWLLDQPGVTAPIVGASSPQQVAENMQALSWKLEPEHQVQLCELSRHFSHNLGPYDTLWKWHSRATPPVRNKQS